jgi:hypothetical protein
MFFLGGTGTVSKHCRPLPLRALRQTRRGTHCRLALWGGPLGDFLKKELRSQKELPNGKRVERRSVFRGEGTARANVLQRTEQD